MVFSSKITDTSVPKVLLVLLLLCITTVVDAKYPQLPVTLSWNGCEILSSQSLSAITPDYYELYCGKYSGDEQHFLITIGNDFLIIEAENFYRELIKCEINYFTIDYQKFKVPTVSFETSCIPLEKGTLQ